MKNSAAASLARLGIYSLLVLIALLVLPHLASRTDRAIFQEGHLIEQSQSAVLIASMLTLAAAAWRWPVRRQLLIILALVTAIAIVRESDSFLDRLIPFLGWKLPAGLILSAILAYGWARRAEVRVQVKEFAGTLPMGMLWAGFVSAVGVAQLIGDWRFLTAVLGEAYQSHYKRAIEETLELMGYAILAMGSLECLCSGPRAAEVDAAVAAADQAAPAGLSAGPDAAISASVR